MVNVIKPTGKWFVRVYSFNEDCPYLCFPSNYHGCKHHDRYQKDGDIKKCERSNCPIYEVDMPTN